MKFGLKYLAILAWLIIATLMIVLIKIFVILNLIFAFVFGIIWRLKPFKTYIPFTLKHLWDIDGVEPWTSHFNPRTSKKVLEYKELYFFWRD